MATDLVFEEIAPGTVLVPLSGKLMLGQGGAGIVGLVEELLRQGKRIFIFDLSEVAAIDSTGIGHFIASYNKIMAAGGDMRMVGATGHVLESFRISLLDTVFRFFPDVAAARQA